MTNPSQVEDFFDQYVEITLAVLDDQRSNMHLDMEMSNAEIAEEICGIMDWQDFDVLAQFPFEDIYNTGSESQILAYFYLSHLRIEVFNTAEVEGMGDREFNRHARAFSEYWFMKLRDKYDSIVCDIPLIHMWLH